jgi:hypothetical protein
MSISENELETLELWLDGELPEDQTEALRRRLSAEPQLAEALDRLRGDRQLRTRAWQSLEPGDGEVETLVTSVRRSVRKEELLTNRLRILSRVAGLAASLAIVFTIGWVSRERIHVGSADQTTVAQSLDPSTLVPPSSAGIGSASIVYDPQVPPPSMRLPGYRLALVDPRNRVIGMKEFRSAQDVQSFLDQMAQFQRQQLQLQMQPQQQSRPGGAPANLPIVPVNKDQP